MADFWRDLVLTAMRNMSVTLGTVLPSILAMLTLVVLGAVLGWIAWALVGRLARAMDLDQRSRTWGVTSALARAGGALVGGLVRALALAFGLGGRHRARELRERRYRREREAAPRDSITHL